MPSPLAPLYPVGEGADPPFTCCDTQESGPCSSSGLHSRADPVYGVQVSCPRNMSMSDLPRLIWHMVAWVGKRCPRPCHLPMPEAVGELALRSKEQEGKPFLTSCSCW